MSQFLEARVIRAVDCPDLGEAFALIRSLDDNQLAMVDSLARNEMQRRRVMRSEIAGDRLSLMEKGKKGIRLSEAEMNEFRVKVCKPICVLLYLKGQIGRAIDSDKLFTEYSGCEWSLCYPEFIAAMWEAAPRGIYGMAESGILKITSFHVEVAGLGDHHSARSIRRLWADYLLATNYLPIDTPLETKVLEDLMSATAKIPGTMTKNACQFPATS
jgi:hypothetical protein